MKAIEAKNLTESNRWKKEDRNNMYYNNTIHNIFNYIKKYAELGDESIIYQLKETDSSDKKIITHLEELGYTISPYSYDYKLISWINQK